MIDFYDNLWNKKMSRIEALRQAQLKMVHQTADHWIKTKEPHPELAKMPTPPLYWAGFVLSGDWR
jgi:CHAT domain-containing protein